MSWWSAESLAWHARPRHAGLLHYRNLNFNYYKLRGPLPSAQHAHTIPVEEPRPPIPSPLRMLFLCSCRLVLALFSKQHATIINVILCFCLNELSCQQEIRYALAGRGDPGLATQEGRWDGGGGAHAQHRAFAHDAAFDDL